MAEERLIDDDKDRKYKIVKNKDGEEELIIIEPENEQEDEEEETHTLDYYEYADDEDLTVDELAERNRLRQEAIEEDRARLADKMQKAEIMLEEGDYESALFNLNQVEEVAEDNGEFYCLKLKVLTRNFTDFVSLENCAKTADGVKKYATSEQKEALNNIALPYKNKYKDVEKTTKELLEEHESAKEERRSTFAELKGKALKRLIMAGVPFALFLVFLIIFGYMWGAVENGIFLIFTIVFAALSLIALILTAITLRMFLEARRRVWMNERDDTTKLGREYLNSKTELEYLQKIITSFDNDLS